VRKLRVMALAQGSLVAAYLVPLQATAAVLPEIRMTVPAQVPACVTPERLMRHVKDRNPGLDARFRDIARYYKQHGEALRVRWDYAFFQTLLETNYLSFRRPDGRWGDVQPRQNNFAGIGVTGGGVPGDSFPDVSSGVLAQMQHLTAYSGERVANPVAPRTRAKQEDIIAASLALRRSVRFSDLTRRWAADRNYATSIEAVASRYREQYCPPGSQHVSAAAAPPAQTPAATACDVWSASYGGGAIALLIRAETAGSVNYTVLEVEKGLEESQADAFMRQHARNGRTIARFDSRQQALSRAFSLCRGPS
jgi:hypothetical protein